MSSCAGSSTGHEEIMPRRLKFNNGRDCIKCKANPGKVVIRHAVYCKECFTPLVTLKFRRSLEPYVDASTGKSKRPKLKASGSLVLGFSGGLGSSILVDTVHKMYFDGKYSMESSIDGKPRGGTNHPRSANVWSSCAVCYVEVCSAFPETHDRTKEVMDALASYPKFDFIPLRLEYAFDNAWWRTITATDQDRPKLAIELGKDGLFTEALTLASSYDVPPVDALRAYLQSLPTQTAISSAIRVLVRLLLLYTACSRRASHLLLGTSLTALSISLISCISQGGGHSILEEFQEEWQPGMPTTDEDTGVIRVVQPLRDVTLKECAIFAWWNSIHVIGRGRQTRATAGIPGLTKNFIVGLEKNYPSTVSTIVRTCAKLVPKSASLRLCILCQRPIQEGIDDWKSRISIRSYSDTKLRPDLVYLPTPPPLSGRGVSATYNQCPSIALHLCYSCRTMHTSRGSRIPKPTISSVDPNGRPLFAAPLPLWASGTFAQLRVQDKESMASESDELWVRKPQDETQQRNKIAGFLLDT